MAPDGSHLAFVARDETGQADLVSVRLDGTDDVHITDDVAVEAMPAWSPDGSRYRLPHGRVRRVPRKGLRRRRDPSGQDISRPVVGLVDAIAVSWSPDGAWLPTDPPVEQGWVSTTDSGTGPLYQLTTFDPNLRSYEHPLFSWGPMPPSASAACRGAACPHR